MSQEKKYQVFISSTYTDLIEARGAAINTVLESYNFPVGMEHFGADSDEQWIIIKDLIDSSDYYILIIGHRYGSLTKTGISFTEQEFDYALEKGVKLMCFVRKDNVATLPHERDEESGIKEKLAKFRTKVTTDRTCEFWDSVDDLKHKISNSLYKNMRKHGGTGWVRGDQVSGQLAEEMAKLSEENRKLREENELLKSKSEVRKPKLKICFNDISNDLSTDKKNIILKFPFLTEIKKFSLPPKRSINDSSTYLQAPGSTITLMHLIGGKRPEDFFDDYNFDIDSITDENISNHNRCLQLLEQLTTGLLNLKINIINEGTALATNVNIEIKFPEFISVIDNNSKHNIEYYNKSLNKNLIKLSTPEQRSHNYLQPNFYDSSSFINGNNLGLNKLVNQQVRDHFDNDVNTIFLSIDTLLHSKGKIFDGYYIFPKAQGVGEIEINWICSEYSLIEDYKIPITIE
ncbi:DUF4062 domain-containing protein [Acinetobacter bohemicus]|uniref:DUF4062 domain-containing protein n=1 Tax=Acinetobacter bohemicus TaxID=1435036 RepID=UPI00192CA2F6|nr:DUF4062 domain-containing protein [Acinetobacter bohemicus]CAD9194157.1 hypothetical protein QAC21B_00244 [Acinetobacter bohemicus]CAD9194910.1 hypothetical protein QAC21B_01011 [Acinetobacter bohemicus]